MTRLLPRLPAMLALALGLLGTAAAAPDDAAFHRRAADCVAVLERDASALATRVQAGDKAARPGLLKLTEQGFTFVGRAYLRGLRKAEADRLVDEAKVAQKSLPPEPLQQLSASCQAEGARLFADANALERALVTNRAKARVESLLAAKKPR